MSTGTAFECNNKKCKAVIYSKEKMSDNVQQIHCPVCKKDFSTRIHNTKGKIIELCENEGYLGIFWHRDDVISMSKKKNIILNDKQIDDICRKLEKDFDSEHGINWSDIEDTIVDAVSDIIDVIEVEAKG